MNLPIKFPSRIEQISNKWFVCWEWETIVNNIQLLYALVNKISKCLFWLFQLRAYRSRYSTNFMLFNQKQNHSLSDEPLNQENVWANEQLKNLHTMKSKMLILFDLHFVSIKCQFMLVILSHKMQEKNIANFWCFHHKYEKDRSYLTLKIWTHNRMRKKNSFSQNQYLYILTYFFTISLYITFRSNTFSGFFIG